jgi:NAD(P)-dependent dehydrogenase (short-subunit alcohol dehydrogenase family)
MLSAARDCVAAPAGTMNLIAGDLTNAAEVQKVVTAAGRIDGLVNAPASIPSAADGVTVRRMGSRACDQLARPSLRAGDGTQHDCRRHHAQCQHLVDRERWRPGIAHYGASKAGLNQLTRVLAVELAPSNIRVNAILPGVIATERVTGSITSTVARAEMDAKIARIPMQRLGTPEEIAELAVFLLSDASSYTTGGLFTVDGGFSLGMARY